MVDEAEQSLTGNKNYANRGRKKSGHTVKQTYGERRMTSYVVSETEMRSLSLANAVMAAFLSLGTGAIGMAWDIQQSILLGDQVVPAVKDIGRPALVVIAIVFYAIAIGTYFLRQGILDIIKRESVPPDC
jgi:hypothetical protein